MSTTEEFNGWVGHDKSSVNGTMKWESFTPRPFTDSDVDIKITHCGVCATDVHMLRSGWGATLYPCVVGHEIVGTAVRVGANVKHVKVGDRVGAGAQGDSCRKPDCAECADGNENFCAGMITTYGMEWPGTTERGYGGYADFHRAVGNFTFKIPDGLDSVDAAPMLCAGITVYSPLKRNGCGPGKRVGIVGVGGLGHFGLLWAKAMGAKKIVAISRSSTKKADAEKMGATGFIATGEEKDWETTYARTLDLIVSTVSSHDLPLSGYLSLLAPHGQFIQIGSPEDELPRFSAFHLMNKGAKLGGSCIGPPWEINEMLEFAAKNKIKGWTTTRLMEEANKVIVEQDDGKARYRYVLVNR
ncbi:GroES-like protein [Microthyrium microscopicum]|uniref:alcohol dehydrogenase (NADP(+)) n=1 Tax=Microthyrium microscopicum TaxID=703497 RepID=A0A6A6UQD1_9PEZI|nr:GroES-like protein [Microthyrium microscopicum]